MQVVKNDTSTSLDVDYSIDEVEAMSIEILSIGSGCLQCAIMLILALLIISLIFIYGR